MGDNAEVNAGGSPLFRFFVGFPHGPEMMAQPAGRTAGSECAARIHIPSAPKSDAAQPSRLNFCAYGQFQQQQAAAGLPRQTDRTGSAGIGGGHPSNPDVVQIWSIQNGMNRSIIGFVPPKEAKIIAPGCKPGERNTPNPQAPKERHNVFNPIKILDYNQRHVRSATPSELISLSIMTPGLHPGL